MTTLDEAREQFADAKEELERVARQEVVKLIATTDPRVRTVQFTNVVSGDYAELQFRLLGDDGEFDTYDVFNTEEHVNKLEELLRDVDVYGDGVTFTITIPDADS